MGNLETLIELPEILNIPHKLIPIITKLKDFRYFLIDGGRSSGKTQSVARLISWLCEQSTIRVVCGREIQNSIEESVYTVFSDLIRNYGLAFNVMATKIDHVITGSEIRFRGFREQGRTNIKGLEGVDVLWVDESQSITKDTLDVIIPTIRKNTSKIFWTMNRFVPDDPVYAFFSGRPDCLHIHIDYFENSFCPEAMKKEAEACRNKSLQDYNHIWLGIPLEKGDDYLFSWSEIDTSTKIEAGKSGEYRILSCDPARFGDDSTVFTVVEAKGGPKCEQIHVESHKGKDLMWTVGRFIDLRREYKVSGCICDADGLGGGAIDRLKEVGVNVTEFHGGAKARSEEHYGNKRSEGYFDLKHKVSNGYIKLLANHEQTDELLTIRYKYTSKGQKMIVSKDEMRKDGIKSPDTADALMMAISIIGKSYQQEYKPQSMGKVY